MLNLIISNETVTAAHTLSQLGTDHEAKASIENIPKKMNRTPITFDIFSGTGLLGDLFAEELHWKVYSIDICKKYTKRSNGVCADVLEFDFSK